MDLVSQNQPVETPEAGSLQHLLKAMGNGERQAAAEFVTRYGPRIRRRIRGKMRASMRRLFDSQDILSTLSRRLDAYVHGGRFEARSEDELWGLVFKIAERSVAEKARIWKALSESDGHQDRLARQCGGAGEPVGQSQSADPWENEELEELLECIPQQVDRQIARLWARDLSSEVIASELQLSVESVRVRWTRTRARLKEQFIKVGQ